MATTLERCIGVGKGVGRLTADRCGSVVDRSSNSSWVFAISCAGLGNEGLGFHVNPCVGVGGYEDG